MMSPNRVLNRFPSFRRTADRSPGGRLCWWRARRLRLGICMPAATTPVMRGTCAVADAGRRDESRFP